MSEKDLESRLSKLEEIVKHLMLGEHACESCGSFDNVEYTEDPFRSDVNGDYSKHFLCRDCIHNSAMEI